MTKRPAVQARSSPRATSAQSSRPPGLVQGCTNLKLRQLSRVVSRHYEAHVARSGLKITQYSLLSAVVKLGPVGLTDLAAMLRLDASTLSRNLQPLVDRGLVEVRAGEADARSRFALATAAGQALRTDAQHDWKQAQLALNQRLGLERVAILHSLLDEALALLEPSTEGDDHD